MVDSPEYPCQLVLVVKLAAVLNADARLDRAEVLRIERQHVLQSVGRGTSPRRLNALNASRAKA